MFRGRKSPISRDGRRLRRGITSMIAMLFLVVVTVLSIGFFSTTTISVQISKNDRDAKNAQFAGESGMQFVRYQLGLIDISPSVTPAQLLQTVASQMGPNLNGTANMNGNSVAVTNGTIYIPAPNQYTD